MNEVAQIEPANFSVKLPQHRGLYVIPDPKMLKPNFGPSAHIEVGKKYLAREFEMDAYVMGAGEYKAANSKVATAHQAKSGKKPWKLRSKAWGLLRDVKTLVKNHLSLFRYYREIKAKEVDFIYERAEYLNYCGLIIARWLKIPHFYEVNWVHALGIQQYYSSYFQPIAKKLEERAYDRTDCAFFIGNQHDLLKLKRKRWQTTQNGIPLAVLDRNSKHVNRVEEKIHACVVANLMPHHRFDILVEALEEVKGRERLVLHLLGYNFEPYLEKIPSDIEVIAHGPVPKHELPRHLKKFNIALISGGPQYSSFMKLYEYAAAKLLIICPELQNIVNNFSENEILFFENENPSEMARVLQKTLDSPEIVPQFGEAGFEKVKKAFTWEVLFDEISEKINSFIK